MPCHTREGKRQRFQAAIWAVGLTRQVPDSSVQELTELLKGISEEINDRYSQGCNKT